MQLKRNTWKVFNFASKSLCLVFMLRRWNVGEPFCWLLTRTPDSGSSKFAQQIKKLALQICLCLQLSLFFWPRESRVFWSHISDKLHGWNFRSKPHTYRELGRSAISIYWLFNERQIVNQSRKRERKKQAMISKNKPFAKLDLLLRALQILFHQHQLSGDLITIRMLDSATLYVMLSKTTVDWLAGENKKFN